MEACWSVLVKCCLGGKNDKDATASGMAWHGMHGCERKMLRQKRRRKGPVDTIATDSTDDSTPNSQALALPTRIGPNTNFALRPPYELVELPRQYIACGGSSIDYSIYYVVQRCLGFSLWRCQWSLEVIINLTHDILACA